MAPRPSRARHRPALPWPVLAAAVLVALLLILGARAVLLARQGHTPAADAQTAVGALGDGGGVLAWRPDLGGPREMEPNTREAITDSWLRGEREIRYAARSGNPAGLRDLFQEAALDDARAAAASGDALLTWGHAPQLRFYSPDGTTVAFTDTLRYVALNPDTTAPPEVLRLAARTLDVAMTLDDGNWRTHHQRVTADRELPPAPLGLPPTGFLAVRAGPGWWLRPADTLRRDVTAMRDLKLGTLLLPVDTPSDPRALAILTGSPGTGVTGPLGTVLGAARAARVAVVLDVHAPGLDPLRLPALDAALRAVPPGLAVAGVLLDPGGTPTAERLDAWRRVIRDRQGGVPVGLRGDDAPGPVEFRVGRGAWPTYHLRWWPGWPLTAARRAWQVQQFITAHPDGAEVGTLYDEPGGTRGLLTPDGSLRPEARGVRGDARRPGLRNAVTEGFPLLLLFILEWRRTRRVNLRARQERR